MATDLDQAYIINGDDLRIALERGEWAVTDVIGNETRACLRFPAMVARVVLKDVAKPYEARTADVQALARALSRTRIMVEQLKGDGPLRSAIAANPEALAETLLEEMDEKAHPMPASAACDCVPGECNVCPGAPQRETLTGISDREIDAIAAIRDALTGLPAGAQRDILAYWTARTDREIAAADPF
jgi:hypothetical protein